MNSFILLYASMFITMHTDLLSLFGAADTCIERVVRLTLSDQAVLESIINLCDSTKKQLFTNYSGESYKPVCDWMVVSCIGAKEVIAIEWATIATGISSLTNLPRMLEGLAIGGNPLDDCYVYYVNLPENLAQIDLEGDGVRRMNTAKLKTLGGSPNIKPLLRKGAYTMPVKFLTSKYWESVYEK